MSVMSPETGTSRPVPPEFAQALRELQLADAPTLAGMPLTGGVSSDIWLIETPGGQVCAKRALAKLRVAADWRAPIERNLYEGRWMQAANAALPGSAPQVLGQHPALGVLVMGYQSPREHSLWKERLRDGDAGIATARAVGGALVRIHSWSAARPELAADFDTDQIFFDIRLEPYLLATARRHPDLAPRLEELVGQTQRHKLALVHGDVSPKNILLGPRGPVFLDAALIALDGTANRARLGANALLSVSLAAAQAAASARGEQLYRYLGGDAATLLPMPQIQIFGGGAHAGRRVDIQDFMVVCPGATSFAQALEWTAEVYRHAGLLMAERGQLLGVADEGGWWPAFETNEDALTALVAAIERAGLVPGEQVAIALDVAASEFGREGRYTLGLERRELDSDGLIELLLGWCERFPIASIEDPLAEDDGAAFARFTAAVGARVQVVGDDFLVSSAELVRRAAEDGAANTVLLKPNQRGTLTETLECWQQARALGFSGIVSARSGESEDTAIVHLAIGWGVGQLKVGSFARSERMAKWNEALRIEEELGAQAGFAGPAVFGRNRR